MGFTVGIKNEVGLAYYDDKWDGAKHSYQSEFYGVIARTCTDVRFEDVAWPGDQAHEKRRPANEAETEALRAELRLWPADRNRDLFLHAVEVVAADPERRFVPSY